MILTLRGRDDVQAQGPKPMVMATGEVQHELQAELAGGPGPEHGYRMSGLDEIC